MITCQNLAILSYYILSIQNIFYSVGGKTDVIKDKKTKGE